MNKFTPYQNQFTLNYTRYIYNHFGKRLNKHDKNWYFRPQKRFTIMYTLYAIPNCDTVKKARVWLAEHDVEYQFHDYKKQGIDRKTIEHWLMQKPWEELVNRAGMTWKQLPDIQKPTNADEAIALMIEKPSVIRRPLIEADGQIVALGFKADAYNETFSN